MKVVKENGLWFVTNNGKYLNMHLTDSGKWSARWMPGTHGASYARTKKKAVELMAQV